MPIGNGGQIPDHEAGPAAATTMAASPAQRRSRQRVAAPRLCQTLDERVPTARFKMAVERPTKAPAIAAEFRRPAQAALARERRVLAGASFGAGASFLVGFVGRPRPIFRASSRRASA
jgi:hypothetical protein